MFDIIIEKLKELFSSRLLPIVIIFFALFSVLVGRIFHLQIVEGQTFQQEVTIKNQREREINSTRGNFYDRNGVLLAYNEVVYSVMLEDSAVLTSNSEKNDMLFQLITILEKLGNEIEVEFGLSLNEENELVFNQEGTARLRFKKEAYGLSKIENLSEEQRNSTAEEVFEFLRYGDKQAAMFKISEEYTIEEALKIMALRYAFFTNAKKYEPILISSNVSEDTVSAVLENAVHLPGVEIVTRTKRVYNESLYTAHIMGYTGLINATELESLNEELLSNDPDAITYKASDVVGKSGLEKVYESYLSGVKGKEKILVNGAGKYLETETRIDPIAGDDIYLTIDVELTKAIYHIIERNLAGIILSKINNSTDAGTRGVSASDIKIPIYDVYYNLLANVIDIRRFQDEDASDLEKQVYQKFLTKQKDVLAELDTLLSPDNTKTSKTISDKMNDYLSYIYSEVVVKNVLLTASIDREDENYKAYRDDKLSLSKYLQYAISSNWIDLSKLDVGDAYFSTEELYEKLREYIKEELLKDGTFHKKIYSDLVYSYNLSGIEISLLLFEQDVLKYDEEEISKLKNGSLSAYTFITNKIKDLSITPAQLALDPYSASVVVTDVNTGEVVAMVSYPSYDNNMLANRVDSKYWQKLQEDLTHPLIHRATKSSTAPGSTYKMVSSVAGLEEGVIGLHERITDQVTFTKVGDEHNPKCWSSHGHGSVDVEGALEVSCNYFYYEVGWRLGHLGNTLTRDANGLDKLKKYASMFGFDRTSGVEVEESAPRISDTDSIRSSIGQGTNNFTPVQISRYVTTVANGGTLYDLTLIGKIVDKDGKVILENKAKSEQLDDVKPSTWKAVQEGMYLVGHGSKSSSSGVLKDFPYAIAGKTGTAQESKSKGNHALFVSYAPFDNPEISITTVIPNGYASGHAVELTKDLYSYYYNTTDRAELVNGDARMPGTSARAFGD